MWKFCVCDFAAAELNTKRLWRSRRASNLKLGMGTLLYWAQSTEKSYSEGLGMASQFDTTNGTLTPLNFYGRAGFKTDEGPEILCHWVGGTWKGNEKEITYHLTLS